MNWNDIETPAFRGCVGHRSWCTRFRTRWNRYACASGPRNAKWIAYATDRSGRFQIEVRSFPKADQPHPVSVEGGGYPRWRADGRELYFLSANGRMMAASFTGSQPPRIGIPAPLFEVELIAHPDRGSFATYEYDVSADGSRFLINRMVSPAESSMAVTVDWDPSR